MDEELFELCKDVYERTGWKTGQPGFYRDNEVVSTSSTGSFIQSRKARETLPLYTSDYLLEKLPRNINETTNELLVSRWASRWRACYMPINLGHFPEQRTEADTPLKALLMLVIALDDAGQLVAAETTA